MEFFTKNLEIFIPILAIVIDALVGSLDNSKVQYKGVMLRIMALIGDAADNALKHDSTKKILPLVLLVPLFYATVVSAEVATWMYPKEVTVAWDAVTNLVNEDGTESLITEGTVEYQIAIAKEDKANPVKVWRGPELTAVIDLSKGGLKGNLLLGIKTYLVVDGNTVAESEYGWTDDPEIVNAELGTFGFRLFLPPATVSNFRMPAQ